MSPPCDTSRQRFECDHGSCSKSYLRLEHLTRHRLTRNLRLSPLSMSANIIQIRIAPSRASSARRRLRASELHTSFDTQYAYRSMLVTCFKYTFGGIASEMLKRVRVRAKLARKTSLQGLGGQRLDGTVQLVRLRRPRVSTLGPQCCQSLSRAPTFSHKSRLPLQHLPASRWRGSYSVPLLVMQLVFAKSCKRFLMQI